MQFIDLKAQYAALKKEIDESIARVLDSGTFILGPEVEKLEKMLADYTGRSFCLTCANGTDALQLVFMALNLGPGDAVFCPDITFIASVEPACLLGATPVFCDIDPASYNLSPQSLEQQIQAVVKEGRLKPKLLVAVDFLGNPADYQALEEICEKYGLIMVADAAQSFGAEYQGQKCGKFGLASITSFFPAKPLGCYGDGGAIFTDDRELAGLMESLRVHGKGPLGKYNNVRIGLNSRLDAIQAAILQPKLSALQNYEIEARQKVAARYNAAFSGFFTTPFISPGSLSVYAQYALLAENEQMRDKIIGRLGSAGIPNMIYYPTPMHKLPVFADAPLYAEGFAASTDYCARTFSLPMHPYLSEAEQNQIIQEVLKAHATY